MRPVSDALSAWGLEGASAELIAARENAVYRVDRTGKAPLALRFRRPGYRTRDEMRSELQMMDALGSAGLFVPNPVRSPGGELLQTVGGHDTDILEWVEGKAISELTGMARLTAFQRLGALAARVHTVFDNWDIPESFKRPSWDREGLTGENPLWGRFWENPALDGAQKSLLKEGRKEAAARLAALEDGLDYGLIHADMVGENVLAGDSGPALIDFDDAGFGFRLFEIATILQHQLEAPDYHDIRAAVLEGYGIRQTPDPDGLELFLLLRSWTYLGWIITRLEEPGGQERCAKFITRCTRRTRQWLDGAQLT